jgi:hypothetical protein
MATESKFSAAFTSLMIRPSVVQVNGPAPNDLRQIQQLYAILQNDVTKLYGYTDVFQDMYVLKPVLVDGRMQMYGERAMSSKRPNRKYGITLNVYAQVSGWKKPKYECVRSETVPFGTSRKEQERVLQAMCDIYATKEQADYRLVCPWKGLHEIKQHLRPEKGRW